MKFYVASFGVLAVVTLGLAACSTSAPSTTSPQNTEQQTQQQASSPEPLPNSGAPKVENPLPRSVLDGEPCTDALTPAQVKDGLGIATPGQDEDIKQLGSGCTWKNSETAARVSVIYVTNAPQGSGGLSASYKNVKPKAEVWKELTVQGFPAAASVTPSGGTPDEFCQVTVGIADDYSVGVNAFISTSKRGTLNPCDAASDAASMIIGNLRQKAGQ